MEMQPSESVVGRTMRRTARQTMRAVCLVTGFMVMACGPGDDVMSLAEPLNPAFVTGEAADALDARGQFVLPGPVAGSYPEISAGQARKLAAAYIKTYGSLALKQ